MHIFFNEHVFCNRNCNQILKLFCENKNYIMALLWHDIFDTFEIFETGHVLYFA